MTFSKIVKENKSFFIPVLIFIGTGIVFLSLNSKDDIHLWINHHYSPFFDIFFKYLTHLGDGWIFPLGIIILAFVKWRYALGLLVCSLLSLFLIGSLKNMVFKDVPRPIKYFENTDYNLRVVEGVKMNTMKSFPSGHSTAAFAFWGFLALLGRNKVLKFLFFSIAALAAYSRMYLSQHFLEDIVAGTFLGILISIFSYYFSSNWKKEWMDKKINI